MWYAILPSKIQGVPGPRPQSAVTHAMIPIPRPTAIPGLRGLYSTLPIRREAQE